MSYNIDLGGWGSVFAVPTTLVDKGLKLASDTQLKVLLYILRNSDKELSDDSVAQALSVHSEDVRDAIEYWASQGLFVRMGESIAVGEIQSKPCSLPQAEPPKDLIPSNKNENMSANTQATPKRIARAARPEYAFVVKRMKTDSKVALLMQEADRILGKMLSNADKATLLMLHDTDGLPVEVLLMLMEHCSKIGKGNLRYIERTGMKWAEDGITTVELAEEKIKRHSESNDAFNKVAVVFGLRLGGTPTKKQLAFADCWVNRWGFSEDMLRFAYEKCVDSKGELNMSYINGILRKWHESGFCKPSEVEQYESASKPAGSKTGADSQPASYDIDAYEKMSIFDD